MKIFVKTVAGRTIPLDVESTDTIEDVAKKIQKSEGIPSNQNCLIFDGKRLKNSYTLANCGIQNESILQLEWDGREGYTWYYSAHRKVRALALKFHLDKKICRKCYARLPPRATNCRKKKCGHSNQLREKKGFRYYNWRRILD